MTSAQADPVLIVGGGLGGLAAALALSKRSISSRVLEKMPEFVELGAGLQLAPNATRILRQLGVLEAAAAEAVFPQRIILADAITGDAITSLDLNESFVRRFGAPYIVMHRGDLLSALVEGCARSGLVNLEVGKEVVQIEDRIKTAAAQCADGTEYRGDVLIGADGLWSSVRKMITDDELICAQYVAYRGAVPTEQVSHEIDLKSVVMWVGPEMHFVQYPLRLGELYNQVAVFRSHRYVADSDNWGLPEELEEHYAKACLEVRKGLSLIVRDRRWPMYDREPISTWVHNRIALLGDAAHPMLQYAAQGACQAIEDAEALALHLASDTNDARDARAALLSYAASRAPRTARVQRIARVWGDICHIDGVGRQLRNALLAQRGSDDYGYVDWLYSGGPLPAPR